jgi:hypothetical protein
MFAGNLVNAKIDQATGGGNGMNLTRIKKMKNIPEEDQEVEENSVLLAIALTLTLTRMIHL